MPGIFLNTNPDHALTVGWLVKMSVGFEIESSDKTEEEKGFLKQNKAKGTLKPCHHWRELLYHLLILMKGNMASIFLLFLLGFYF